MKQVSLLVAGLVGTLTSSSALVQAEPRPAMPIWSGVYFGVNGGAGSFDAEVMDLEQDMFDDEDVTKGVGLQSFEGVYGIQAGANLQLGTAVLGLEADINGTKYDERLEFGDDFDFTAEAGWDWFGTVRARLGVAVENTLVYATGGLAIVRVDYCGADDQCVTDDGDDLAFEETELGFAAGVGAEVQIDPAWSLKSEYLYVDAGEEIRQYDDDQPDQKARFESNAHIFRVGLNYHVRDVPLMLESAQPLK